jgi:hypothetical protein
MGGSSKGKKLKGFSTLRGAYLQSNKARRRNKRNTRR